MTDRVVVIGGGTGGTLAANRMRRTLSDDVQIVVIDPDAHHLYQPGLLFVPFGLASPHRHVRPRREQLRDGVEYRQSAVEHVDLDADLVILADGTRLTFDVLVIASGARLLPEETEGLTGADWGTRVHTFYSLPGAIALAQSLADFDHGRLVVNLIDLPIKCPVAPLEFCFLADWFLRRRGVRDRVDLTYVTALDGAFTKPTASRELSGLLAAKGIEVVTEFATGQVDSERHRLVSYDEREVEYDLAVVVPVHGGAEYVTRSTGLGDALGFVPTDPATLQAKAKHNVFVIGDATDLPASKAGSVAHFEGEVLVHNVAAHLAGREPDARFDGHTNCFIETGDRKALLIDFDYDLEPVPGHFPGRFGLPLLKESRLNHIGKRAFEQLYWRAILPGRDIPLIHGPMPRTGKQPPAVDPAAHALRTGAKR